MTPRKKVLILNNEEEGDDNKSDGTVLIKCKTYLKSRCSKDKIKEN